MEDISPSASIVKLPTQIPKGTTDASSVLSSVSSSSSLILLGERSNTSNKNNGRKKMLIQGESTSTSTSSTADGPHKKRKQQHNCENKKRNNQHVLPPDDSIVSDMQDEAFLTDDPQFGDGGSRRNDVEHSQGDKIRKMEEACRTILECIGEDPSREGLVQTPHRWAKSLFFMCKGYAESVQTVTNGAIFEEHHQELVVVRGIDIHSLCEHHMVPFSGKVHVGYIPNGKILGLSKIARIAEVFARRLQVQERLTQQIADAIVEAVSPQGVAVVVECQHFCMVMRGVEKCGSQTYTSCFRGCFEHDSQRRLEFSNIIHRQR